MHNMNDESTATFKMVVNVILTERSEMSIENVDCSVRCMKTNWTDLAIKIGRHSTRVSETKILEKHPSTNTQAPESRKYFSKSALACDSRHASLHHLRWHSWQQLLITSGTNETIFFFLSLSPSRIQSCFRSSYWQRWHCLPSPSCVACRVFASSDVMRPTKTTLLASSWRTRERRHRKLIKHITSDYLLFVPEHTHMLS